jgi:hypothetical protein
MLLNIVQIIELSLENMNLYDIIFIGVDNNEFI